jgi:thiamine-phosphate pyrophosphorylase
MVSPQMPRIKGTMVHNKIRDNSLYFVTSAEYLAGRSTIDVVCKAIDAGVDIIQMREKHLEEKDLISLGIELGRICREKGVTFIINDDPYLAQKVGADGVHLGQEDMKNYSISLARDVLGSASIIGVSTHSIEQFKSANTADVDYIAFGPVFETRTKDYYIGDDDIVEVIDIADKPVVFIGGITLENVDIVLDKGGRNIAVIRAIAQAEDILSTVRAFKGRIGSSNI